MRILLALVALMAVFTATPALACKCSADGAEALATKVLADPSISVVDVYVRGMNMRNHQSMLEIKALHSGGLMAQNIRAKFGATSCAVAPRYKETMTLLIKAEDDATYSIVGDCDHSAVMQHLGKGK